MATASGDDEHGEHAFEWAGSFHTPITSGTARNYAWTMQVVDTEWADPTMDLVVMKIDGVTEEDVYYTDVPTATPLLYSFDEQLNHLKRHGEWGDRPTAPRHGRYLADEERVRAAQLAMRQQVLRPERAGFGCGLALLVRDGRVIDPENCFH